MKIDYNNGYQNWKNTILNVLLYRYFQNKIQEQNFELIKRAAIIEQNKQRSEKQQEQYYQIITKLFSSYKKLQSCIYDGLNNQNLIKQICKQNNIELTYQNFDKWIKQGKRF